MDEHTAALDPKTARQTINLTRDLVERLQLTTLMVTHNMNQALELGNRLIMLHQGRVIMDVRGQAKTALKVADLLARFYEVQGESLANDRMILT